ncbi:DUF732 domain-containing protein [Mycobacterium sp. MYCO198283]|uniref:DUF732 domain-containing protein n=1 Tax=Mycobacterium sp. MYCO198283 TaxID=2883505 RepID=UPI001E2F1F03|nr:DUF732 domain-containing protein [Mycobacterium sp. MYCO198283]MCG5432974.1 DUF732 domain-containing protein [Mycobacterium sp. MYCO198283]
MLRRPAAVPLLIAAAVAPLVGCAATDRLMSSVELPATDVTPPGDAPAARRSAPAQHLPLEVSAQQQAYLAALGDDGVTPSSELAALTIGSYVCQARAHGQDDRAVWDFVAPLVRNDLQRADAGAPSPDPARVDRTTAAYVRIATERLC